MSRIATIGAGAWGTALAIALSRDGRHEIRLWSHEEEVRESIARERINKAFLPDYTIPAAVSVTCHLYEALEKAEILISAMPSRHCRGLWRHIAPYVNANTFVVSATKGLEQETNCRMTEVIREVLEDRNSPAPPTGALSGPSFAAEVARGDPTAVAIASDNPELTHVIQQQFSSPRFRVYTNDDVIGVELGGALKNVIAIAAGICDGLGLGHNSVAGLITRGLAEMTRLAVASGGRQETMSGLAGLGDLVLTCTGALSRNRTVGVELGRGRKLPEIVTGMRGMVAEGIFTTQAALGLAHIHGVEMPITEQVHAILHNAKSPAEAIHELMTRSGKSEMAFRAD